MPSVTQRIAQVKQPRGGYVNPTKMLANISLGVQPPFDSKAENVSPGLVGIAVDYLTRVMTGTQDPRLGNVYTLNLADIPAETLHEIEVSVIGYDESAAIY